MRTVDCYTMQIELLGVLVNAIVMITGTKACDNSLCFWWTMKTDRLKLTCKIRFLHYSVTILNPLGEEELSCIPPLQYSKCHAAHGIAEQNLKTNETIVTVWDISSKYNGNWTCLHGFGTGSASVEVFLTSVSGLVKENGNKCIWEFLSWTLIGLLPTFMILRIVTWMCFNRIKDTNLYKTYSHKIKDSIKNVTLSRMNINVSRKPNQASSTEHARKHLTQIRLSFIETSSFTLPTFIWTMISL